jgi:hypothetical protein
MWSDFDDRHGKDCISLRSSLPVRLNMIELSKGQTVSLPQHKQHLPNGHPARYTAETVLRTRPKTYRKIVHLLADPYWSALQISKACRVSEHTVRAIRARETQDIAERKKTLAAMLANVAELGAERMEQTIGKASLRDAVIATGVSVDKVALLTGPKMGLLVNIANILPPTPQEDTEREARHARLDEITRLLHERSQLREDAR